MTRTRRLPLGSFIAIAAVLYLYGVLSAAQIPAAVYEIALPLDFMVGIPLIFYFMVVRPCGWTLLCVIPAIWLGYGLSILALGTADAGILPALLPVLLVVEAVIAVREAVRIAGAFRTAKTRSADPMAWLYDAVFYVVPKEVPARVMAAELSVWYYALFSWRKRPATKSGEAVFGYHNAGGYMNMMLGLALAFPVEVVGVHLLLSQWSVVAAIVVTALSVYAAVWLLGDARARVMRPIIVGEDAVHLECGIQMEALIPLGQIGTFAFSEAEIRGIPDAERLNYGTFYHADVWIVTKRPIEVRTLLGTKRVSAIGISVDDSNAFASLVAERIGTAE